MTGQQGQIFVYLCMSHSFAPHLASRCTSILGSLSPPTSFNPFVFQPFYSVKRNWPVDGALRSGGVPRLALAKDALMALLPKLRPDDRFGLATFSNEGRVIQPLTFVSILQQDEPLSWETDVTHFGQLQTCFTCVV